MTTRLSNVHPSDTTKWPQGLGTFDIGAANEGSKILMYNETPLNLQLDFLNGSTDTLHAWEANFWPLDGDTKQVQWQIDADSLNVSTPPINAVFLTLYGSNEPIHGQYPMALVRQASVGNAGGIATSSVQTLSNENNPPTPILIIDIGNTSHTQLITIYNDGSFSYSVNISGTNHTLMQGSIANLLQLGMLGDLTQILGNLKVAGTFESVGTATHDGAATVTGVLTATAAAGSIVSQANVLNGGANLPAGRLGFAADGDILDGNSTVATYLKSRNSGGSIFLQSPGGTNIALFTSAGERINGGKWGVAADGDILDGSASTQTYIKTRSGGTVDGQGIIFQVPNGTEVAALTQGVTSSGARGNNGQLTVDQINFVTNEIRGVNTGHLSIAGNSAVTVNHGLDGSPAAVLLTTDQATSSGTNSAYSYTSTQFTAFNGAPTTTLDYRWWAYR